MRIAIDFDGTIADTNPLRVALAKKLFGRDLPLEASVSPYREYYINEEEGKQLQKILYGETILQAPIVPGAREAIQRLAAEGHRIVILTARAKEGMHYVEEYMRLNRIPCEHFLYVSKKDKRQIKGKTLTKKLVIDKSPIDVMIEDEPKGFEDPKTGELINAIPILITRPWNKNITVRSGIIRLPNWKAILQFLLTAVPAESIA